MAFSFTRQVKPFKIPFIRTIATVTPIKKSLTKSRLLLNAKPLFTAKGLSKQLIRDRRENLFQNINLNCLTGSKVGIVGVNGSGKTTLMKILSKNDSNYSGDLFYHDDTIRIGYYEQEPILNENLTVLQNIEKALEYQYGLLKEIDYLANQLSHPENDVDSLMTRMSEVQNQIEYHDCWKLEERTESLMKSLGCPQGDKLVSSLSGGQKRRVSFCSVLLSKPDILFLDEPTNHLDMDSIAWLEGYIKNFKGTLFTISHDRQFIDNVSDWILEIDLGKIEVFMGNFSAWAVRKNRLTADEIRKNNAKLKRLEVQLARYKKMTKITKGKQIKHKKLSNDLKEIGGKMYESEKIKKIIIPEGQRLNKNVINVNNLSVSFDDNVILRDINMTFMRNSVVGIVGPNGSGKTTFFRAILGEIKDYSGDIRLSSDVKIGYFSQHHENLDENLKVWQSICGKSDYVDINEGKSIPSRKYVAQFLFKREDQEKPLSDLSGGEINRVRLARILIKGCNVLLLDEPSNNLDIVTLTALEKSLMDFNGLVLCISHDRYFLNKICNYILEFNGEGDAKLFNGNYEHYLRVKNLLTKK